MLAKFSVKKPFAVLVAVVMIIVFGAVAFTRMTPDLLPSINMPYALVMTSDTGASPEEVETKITKPLEQQMATLDHIKSITSQSNENYSTIFLEFSEDVNMDAISVDIREKIDLISGAWEDSVSTPMIMKINPDMMPVNVAAVNMKGMSVSEISEFVEKEVLAPLEGVEGVASINATGTVSEDIQVVLSQEKIDEINERNTDAILAGFSDAKGKIEDGIDSAKKGQDQIEDGKKQLTDAQEQTMSQMEAARLKMQQSKKQLEKLKISLVELEGLKAGKELIEDQMREANPDLTEEEIQELCMKNPIYAQDIEAISAIEQAMKQAGIGANQQPTIAEINQQIEALEKSMSDLNLKQAQAGYTMGNQMSELTASNSMLQSTVSQLQSSLQQIQSSEDAALSSANLTGILTMANVSQILNAQNFSMPAGYVSDDKNQILVSVGDKISGIGELRDLVILDLGMDDVEPVKLSDIADVTQANNAAEVYARINGENGVLLTATKQSGYATADVADRINQKFEELSKEHEGLTFTNLSDQGEYIHMVVNSVLNNLLIGAVLAILILLFFLRDIRPTIITAFSIPISVTFAIALMYFSGITLNVISLSGLAVGVGMLVDNSIVVIENIYRLRALGYSHIKAAVSGTVQVAGAITASTLTTICVFAPIVFVEGMTREIFTDMALTIAYSLLASLFIAMTLAPAMAQRLLRKKTKKTVLSQESGVIRKYKTIVEFALNHRVRVLLLAVALLIVSSVAVFIQGFTYMPGMSSPEMSVTIQMPEDSELRDTADVTDKVAQEVLKKDCVETVGAMLSSSANSIMGMSGEEQDVTQMMMYVILKEDRLDESKSLEKEIEAMGEKYNCKITAQGGMDAMEMMGGVGVQAEIYCDDLDTLRDAALRIERRVENVKGIREVTSAVEDSTPELQITIDKNKAMSRGLTVAQVYAAVAAELQKDQAATELVQSNSGQGLDVKVSNAKTETMDKEDLENLKITAQKQDGSSEKVRLSSIAVITEKDALNAINHQDQKRVLSMTAKLKNGYNITLVTREVKQAIENLSLPSGVTVEYAGENETIMEAMGQLVLMMVLGVLLVYLVMVAQFQSLRSPFIVMFTIPLAFTGGMLALLITGNEFSVVSMIGFVMLVGIIVNNAIVLVDCINRFRLEGMERREAIISAGAVRMRPVLMTAITTVLGLLPMAVGMGNGAEMMQPVAIVCIGGLIYATLMTLIVIPVMYSFLSKKHMEAIREEELQVVDA